MALDDLAGVQVASGTYLYDGQLIRKCSIVARDYDVKWETYAAEGLLEPGEQPAPRGPDGLYYYVSATGPFATCEQAKEWAEQSWGPVDWGK